MRQKRARSGKEHKPCTKPARLAGQRSGTARPCGVARPYHQARPGRATMARSCRPPPGAVSRFRCFFIRALRHFFLGGSLLNLLRAFFRLELGLDIRIVRLDQFDCNLGIQALEFMLFNPIVLSFLFSSLFLFLFVLFVIVDYVYIQLQCLVLC